MFESVIFQRPSALIFHMISLMMHQLYLSARSRLIDITLVHHFGHSSPTFLLILNLHALTRFEIEHSIAPLS